MGFNTEALGKPAEPVPDVPKIYSDRYKHSIVDSQYNPGQNLLTMVSGTPRLVEYYRGVYNSTEEPIAFQPSDINTYQSYTRIKGLVIKEQGEGSFNFDPTSGTSTKTISAYTLFDLVPIKGDILIMDIGDGNAGLFMVFEQPEIFNVTADKVYFIQYKFLEILNSTVFEQLNSRVVEELVYTKDSVLNGGHAVIDHGTFNTQKELLAWRQTIAQHILSNHYWNAERTIALMEPNPDYNSLNVDSMDPFQGSMYYIYDPYLVEFLCGMLTPELRGTYTYIQTHSLEYGGMAFSRKGTLNIWEVIKSRNFNALPQCNHKATWIDTQWFYNTRYYGNIRNTKFTFVLVTNPEDYTKLNKQLSTQGNGVLGNFRFASPAANKEVDYFLSEGFFKGTPTGEFEELMVDILKNNVMDRNRLLAYCNTFWELTPKEQLYHGAILLYLIQLSRKVNMGM